jgi:isopentenyl diphosphate isomerase/L-lactate dehydrogenase-like FMN-dependent dehydrogenase
MNVDLHACNIFDLRDIALKRVPRGLFEFMDRGTEDEVSLKNNRAVFDRLRFRTRTMVDVSTRNQDTVIFGVKRKMPLRDRATCRCFSKPKDVAAVIMDAAAKAPH